MKGVRRTTRCAPVSGWAAGSPTGREPRGHGRSDRHRLEGNGAALRHPAVAQGSSVERLGLGAGLHDQRKEPIVAEEHLLQILLVGALLPFSREVVVFDAAGDPAIAGTLAGDDTIFVATKNRRSQTVALRRLEQWFGDKHEH